MVYTTERTFYESESENENLYGCEGDIDQALTKADLESIYDKAEPISGDVAAKLCESNCNPEALRIVYDESTDEFYMDFNELATYCESTDMDTFLAVGEIIDTYSDSFPTISMENFNIVFPNKDAVMGILESGNELGYKDVAWSSHFLQDCVNKGLRVSGFVDPGISRAGEYSDNEVIGTLKEAVEEINCEIETVMESKIKGAGIYRTVNAEKISLKLQQTFKKACAAIKKQKYNGAADIEKRIRKVERAIKRIDIEIDEYKDKSKAGKAIRGVVKITGALIKTIGVLAGSYLAGALAGAKISSIVDKTAHDMLNATKKSQKVGAEVKGVTKSAAVGAGVGLYAGIGGNSIAEAWLDAVSYVKLLNAYKDELNNIKSYLEGELAKAKKSAE